MLKIRPPNFKFCPFCGQKLSFRSEEGRRRKFCAPCHWTYYPHVSAAAAAVIVRRGKVLLVKRSRTPYKNTWMFPAGFIDFGEHPLETLSREIREETGLKLKEAKFIEVVQTKDDPRSPGHFCFFFKATVLGKKIKTDEEENSAIDWFDLKKLPKIGWQSHQYILRKVREDFG